MPADDLVLNVKQIAGYPPTQTAPPTATLLMQLAGLGSAYASISPALLVGTALAQGGDMAIGGRLQAVEIQGGFATFSNVTAGLFSAQQACIVDLSATRGSIGGVPIATQADISGVLASTVTSFEGRRGAVCLWIEDILRAGGAPNFSPVFGGEPRAPTPPSSSHSSRLATTAFVHRNSVEYINSLLACHPFVFTFNGRSGDVVLTEEDIVNAGGGNIFDSPTLTGVPLAPTAPVGTNTQQIATTAFVVAEIAASTLFAPIASPQFTGFPSGPTAAPGSSTGQLATTAFVMNAVAESTAGVASFNTRTGVVTLTGADITGAGGAVLVSPVFTGTPQGPTAAPGTATNQLATTAFVNAAIGGVGVETFNGRAGAVTLTTADITGAGGAPIASAALTGTPSAPTAAPGVSTTQIATTAFVMDALATGGVTSFNTRTGAITLLASDISAAGGAILASPVFTGVPVAPTATAGTSTAQLATCAFVATAVSASVSSFNGRTGAITLSAADISAAGGAPLASPHFNGSPTSPTPTTGDNSTAIATTAFVVAAIGSAAGVTTFNGRAGAVTLSAADISAAGGAPLASPTFTGIPSAPTAAASTNTTQLATTAFVMNQISLGGGVLSFNNRAGAVTLTLADVTTAFPASTTNPLMNGTAGPGSAAAWSRGDHIHPVDTSRAAQSSLANYLPLAGGTMTAGSGLSVGSAGIVTTGGITLNGANGLNVAGTCSFTGGIVVTNSTGGGVTMIQINGANPLLSAGGSRFWLLSSSSTAVWDNQAAGGGQASLNPDASFQINSATAYKGGGGTWTAPSDDRIKTVLGEYDKGLSEVLALRPVTFVYKGNDTPTADPSAADPDTRKPRYRGSAPFPGSPHFSMAKAGTEFVGFVAQEVEAVFPAMVNAKPGFIDGQAVTDLRTIDVSDLTYALVNAVKTLAARLEILEERLAT